MIRIRLRAALAIAVVLAGSVSAVATPVANADPLEDVKGAVASVRLFSGCGFLNYDIDLEGNAQVLIGNKNPGVPPAGRYNGKTAESLAIGDTTSDAIDELIKQSRASITNCAYKDFGVGMLRTSSDDYSFVSLALGEPGQAAPPPARAPQDPVKCPDGSVTPTVPAGQQCQAKPKAKVTCPEGSPTPEVDEGQQCAAVPAQTNKIDASFGQPGPTSVDFTVTNNSTLNAACDYVATTNSSNPFVEKRTTRSINVDAGQSTTTTFNGFPTFSTYKATLTCKDASGKQTEPLGVVNTSLVW